MQGLDVKPSKVKGSILQRAVGQMLDDQVKSELSNSVYMGSVHPEEH